MSLDIAEAVPAATLVLFRERGPIPELLFVERSRTMAFAGGALVFPGGRIDPGDRALASEFGGDVDDMAARIGAIRETIEEVGVPVGLPRLPPATFEKLRAGLHRGEAIGAVLEELGLMLAPSSLVAFARWLPAHAATRIFDTRFYLARFPADAPDPVVDETENVRAFWATAQGVLDDADAGRVRIIFPTRRNLERLARFASFAEAAANALAHEIRPVTPWIEQRDGEEHLCIPDDLGYPVTSQVLGAVVRG